MNEGITHVILNNYINFITQEKTSSIREIFISFALFFSFTSSVAL